MITVAEPIIPSPFQGEGQGEGAHPRNLRLVNRARALRRAQTDAEKKLWQKLRDRQVVNAKFRRQYPLGNYIVDFICVEAKLIIEVDGSQHNDNAHDAIRSSYLIKNGYTIMRFWNNEVLQSMDSVLQAVADKLTLTPTLSLEGRGGSVEAL